MSGSAFGLPRVLRCHLAQAPVVAVRQTPYSTGIIRSSDGAVVDGCGEIPRYPSICDLLWLDRCERVGDVVVVQVGEALEAGVGAHDQPRAPRVVDLHGHGRA